MVMVATPSAMVVSTTGSDMTLRLPRSEWSGLSTLPPFRGQAAGG
jgi:hypothetical protein